MKIPLIKSRNFTSHEVARTALDVQPETLYLTGYAHGCLQMIRDAASKHFGARFKGLKVTSSNRNGYNDGVEFAAKNSHHEWRIDSASRQLHCAFDMQPLGVTTLELFDFIKANFKGEIGHEPARKVVHFAPVGMEDEAWTDKR